MAITQKDFPALTDDLESIFNEISRTKIEDMSVARGLFDMFDEQRRTHEHLILHAIKGFRELTPGQQLPLRSTDEGDKITYTQRYLGARIPITKEMRLFDLHNQIKSVATSVTASSWDDLNQSLADVLTNGFATTAYTDILGGSITPTAPDSLALFSALHTNGVSTSSVTFRNLIRDEAGTANPTLDRPAVVQARAEAMVHSDPEGVIRPIILDKLIVAPSNEDKAHRVVDSDGIFGSANREINPLKGKLTVEVWPHLETRGSDGTDTSEYWFLADSRKVKESLKLIFAQRPTLYAPEQVNDTKDWVYTIDGFLVYGLGYPAYIWGSTGASG